MSGIWVLWVRDEEMTVPTHVCRRCGRGVQLSADGRWFHHGSDGHPWISCRSASGEYTLPKHWKADPVKD